MCTSHMSCIDDPAGIFGESYNQCLEQIKQQYVTATAIGSMVACLLMGLVANLPIALAPGMGMRKSAFVLFYHLNSIVQYDVSVI